MSPALSRTAAGEARARQVGVHGDKLLQVAVLGLQSPTGTALQHDESSSNMVETQGGQVAVEAVELVGHGVFQRRQMGKPAQGRP